MTELPLPPDIPPIPPGYAYIGYQVASPLNSVVDDLLVLLMSSPNRWAGSRTYYMGPMRGHGKTDHKAVRIGSPVAILNNLETIGKPLEFDF